MNIRFAGVSTSRGQNRHEQKNGPKVILIVFHRLKRVEVVEESRFAPIRSYLKARGALR